MRKSPPSCTCPARNRIRLVTCGSAGCMAAPLVFVDQAAREGFSVDPFARSVVVRWLPSCSPSGTRWAMPWRGRAVS